MAYPLPIDERVKLYWTIAGEEYKSVRDEAKQAELNTFTALQWGAVLLGALMAAGFSQWLGSKAIVMVIFLGFVPLLAFVTLFIWIGEMIRMKRAGDYLCVIEKKMAVLADDAGLAPDFGSWKVTKQTIEVDLAFELSGLPLTDPLNWERWLRDARPPTFSLSSSGHQWITNLARAAFFPLVAFCSMAIGTYHYVRVPKPEPFSLPSWFFSMLITFAWLVIGSLTGFAAWMTYKQLFKRPTSFKSLY